MVLSLAMKVAMMGIRTTAELAMQVVMVAAAEMVPTQHVTAHVIIMVLWASCV
jgi:hypothetical protein